MKYDDLMKKRGYPNNIFPTKKINWKMSLFRGKIDVGNVRGESYCTVYL